MKKLFPFLLFVFCAFQTKAVNVTIVASYSPTCSWCTQDTVWRHVATSMGYSATIVPQSTLDDIANLANTDVLVVASGIADFDSPTQLQTVIQFVMSGRPAYIQSEYQTFYQGNRAFDSLMLAVGADFQWTATVTGPLNVVVSGPMSSEPNAVSAVSSFNYGCSGVGTSVQPFVEYNSNNLAFYYIDSTGANGRVVTVSDEDWCWQMLSLPLMENILYSLSQVAPTNVATEISNNAMLEIFPNPVFENSILRVGALDKNCSLAIYDATGALIRRYDNCSSVTLRRGDLPAGVYFAKLELENGPIATKVFAVQ